MTEEELEKEADKWLVNNLHSTEEDYKQAYLAGAESREKQIENMKCCGNCEHATHDSMNGTFCKYYSEWEHADLKCTQWELGR